MRWRSASAAWIVSSPTSATRRSRFLSASRSDPRLGRLLAGNRLGWRRRRTISSPRLGPHEETRERIYADRSPLILLMLDPLDHIDAAVHDDLFADEGPGERDATHRPRRASPRALNDQL